MTWRRLRALTGVDRAIGWSAAPRIWTALFGPVTVALIATHLTADEQGYYFTFGSIAAMQTLFELGFSSVVLQFAGHERAFLHWTPERMLAGSEAHKSRLASLVRMATRWYGGAALLLALVLIAGGWFFFSLRAGATAWEGPWITVALATAGVLLLSPALATIEGCGAVAEVARIRTEQALAANIVAWAVLIAGGGLWAPAAAAIATLLFGTLRVAMQWRHFFADLLRARGDELSWRREVWPFQWRTALSWMSSYVTLQTLTPLLFLYDGPAAAGRMGMTLSILATMLNIAMAWLWTKRPGMTHHVAHREFDRLDALFFPAMGRAFAVMVAGCVAFVGGTALLAALDHPWRARLLEPAPLMMMTLAILATVIFWAQSAYLRAHKREALLGIRLATAILVVASALLLGARFGTTGMAAGFLAVNVVVTLIGGTLLFLRTRREWHA